MKVRFSWTRSINSRQPATPEWQFPFSSNVTAIQQKDDNFKRKVTVIQELRAMIGKAVHFYEWDFLHELPGLVDFSAFLHLSPTTVREVEELNNLVKKINITWDGSTLYVHAQLRSLLKSSPTDTLTTKREGIDDARMDHILEKLDIREGLKANFFLNLLGLSESGGREGTGFQPSSPAA